MTVRLGTTRRNLVGGSCCGVLGLLPLGLCLRNGISGSEGAALVYALGAAILFWLGARFVGGPVALRVVPPGTLGVVSLWGTRWIQPEDLREVVLSERSGYPGQGAQVESLTLRYRDGEIEFLGGPRMAHLVVSTVQAIAPHVHLSHAAAGDGA
jgi:hypothetical protein